MRSISDRLKKAFQKLKNGLQLYMHYVSINVRSTMQYKTSFFLMTMGQLLTSFSAFFGIYFMFQRFKFKRIGFQHGDCKFTVICESVGEFAVPLLSAAAEEISDPVYIQHGGDKIVFSLFPDPAAGASGDDFSHAEIQD